MKATLIDWMGDDLSVVNAAKVSFGKRSEWEVVEGVWGQSVLEATKVLSKKDQGLIQFLARGCTSGNWDELANRIIDNTQAVDPEALAESLLDGTQTLGKEWIEWCDKGELQDTLNYIKRMPSHWSPFAHTAITLHLKMPIFVARQIMKHTTGIEYNEVSRRYVDSEPEFYVPDVWRKKADNVKQGSSDENAYSETAFYDVPYYSYEMPLAIYKKMLHEGVAPEQARMILPQSMYTEVIATGNLYAWANLYIQRSDSHAQKETQDLAKQVGEIIQPLYPVSWAALVA